MILHVFQLILRPTQILCKSKHFYILPIFNFLQNYFIFMILNLWFYSFPFESCDSGYIVKCDFLNIVKCTPDDGLEKAETCSVADFT
jgi:hypothetical protein